MNLSMILGQQYISMDVHEQQTQTLHRKMFALIAEWHNEATNKCEFVRCKGKLSGQIGWNYSSSAYMFSGQSNR